MSKKSKRALSIANEAGDSVAASIFAGLPLPLFILMSVIYYLVGAGIVFVVKRLINSRK